MVGVVLEFLGTVVGFMFHSTVSTVVTAAVVSAGCLWFAHWLMSEPEPRRAKRAKRRRRRHKGRSGPWAG
ncbi:hypothetical protein DMB38_19940 [Streptomyces sp. WAC 06738]|nr:hypothetical protein DMB38_19940 [Streptomyces sp. WAC 06738]